jgi:drug/metabolite transporter, DME family
LNPLGVSTGLLSGLFFAGYTLFGKETARRNINAWTAMLYSFAFGSIFVMIFNLFPILPGAAGSFTALLPDLPVHGWLILIFLSFVPTLLGFGLYNLSMHYLPASISNLLATSEPALTAVEAYVFLNERMTVIQIVGSLIILSAVLIVQLERVDNQNPALLSNSVHSED